MKTFTGFIFLAAVAACTLCAAQTPATSSAPAAAAESSATATDVPPRTLSSHPDTPGAPQSAPPQNRPGGDYVGYQRIVVNGRELYCRNDKATGSHTERNAVCMTEAQVKAEQLRARMLIEELDRRTGSIPVQPYMFGGMSPGVRH